MKKLKEEDVIRLMREEWSARVKKLTEDVDVVLNSPVGKQGEKEVISPGLKVRHKKSQLRYTVKSVSPRDLILLTPEGEEFLVDAGEVDDYELD